ncbi:MAG: tripartite tricarboxylate transporter substrate binding protein, partial [Comamonadaceae bacterium]
MNRRHVHAALLAGVAALAGWTAPPALAQRADAPIRIVVPFPA